MTLSSFVLTLAGCGSRTNEPSAANVVDNSNPSVNRTIGEGAQQFDVLGPQRVTEDLNKGKLVSAGSAAGRAFLSRVASSEPMANLAGTDATVPMHGVDGDADSLLVGYPAGLLDEQQIFGGVITAVSDTASEKLGTLKLTDIEPIHVRTVVAEAEPNKFVFALLGCVRACGEGSALLPIVVVPIVAVDTEKNRLILDLASLGSELNLIEALDPNGDYTQLKTVSSKVTAFDYSLSTLVFDVDVKMQPKETPSGATTPPADTTFRIRWYLRLASVFNPAFVPRPAAPGVGFFMTYRTSEPRIHRFSRPNSVGNKPILVKYYVKNVPEKFRPAFQSAFDSWNEKFKTIIGGPLLEAEFVDAGSEKAKLLVAGDIRYNILEWDLVNAAGYGGLGPSIANQHTGEILSANVLVQGPKIVELYTKWFEASRHAEQLLAEGRVVESDSLLRRVSLELQARLERPASRLSLRLGEHVMFRIASQQPELEDPIMARHDFELIPPGVTFDTYMAGYFHELVAHELGHNLGLRHNFRGNLGAAPGVQPGKVSTSIMEYLNRSFRHANAIGPYDEMALRYGYAGVAPDKQGMFCTDEDVAAAGKKNNSPECSRDDATADPFGYLETRLARAIELLTLPKSPEAPVWVVDEMKKELDGTITNLGLYAAHAETTGGGWTNFFTGADRPATPAAVKGYVLARLKAQLCDPKLAGIVAAKATEAAKKKTEENLTALRAKAAELLKPLEVYTEADLACAAL